MTNQRLANGFIGTIAAAALTMLAGSAARVTEMHPYQFAVLLLLGAVTSRTKVKLPGINGTMSVNLPFLLIAAAELSLFEAMLVAMASAALQSLPKRGSNFEPIKAVFNSGTMGLSAGAAALLLHNETLLVLHPSGAMALIGACGMFFLANTVPVATIISITQASAATRVWSGIAKMSFPYYVASTGVTSVVMMVSRQVGWQLPLVVLPLMLLMYRCFQELFTKAEEGLKLAPVEAERAQAAAAR